MSTRNSSDFDDSWLDKSSNEINDLDQLLGEQDAAADDLDDLPIDDGDGTLDDAWLEGGEEVVNLSEEDVVAEGAGMSAGSLDDAEFEKWLEATAGGTKTADDDLGLSESGVDEDMEKWLREVAADKGAQAQAEAEPDLGGWRDEATDLDAEDRTVVMTEQPSEFGDTYVQATGVDTGAEEFGMAMPEVPDVEMPDVEIPGDEPFDAERMSLEELTGTGGHRVVRGGDDLDLDSEDELARASAQLGEAFSFDDAEVRDGDAGATGIFYTETMGEESEPPSLSDDRFPPPDTELDEEDRFSFDEPRSRTGDSPNLFERTVTGLRERGAEAASAGAEEFTDMGGGEGGGQSNWLLVALAGIALVAGGAGTWLGMRADSGAAALARRVEIAEQRIAKAGDAQQEVQKLSGGLDELRKEITALAAAPKAAPATAPAGAGAAAVDTASRTQIEELQRITENLSDRLTSLTRSGVPAGGAGEAAGAASALSGEVENLKQGIAELRQQKAAAESQLHEVAKSVEALRVQKPMSEVETEMAALRKQVEGLTQELGALSDTAKRAPKSPGVEVKPLPKPEPKPEVRVEPAEETAAVTPAAKEHQTPAAEPAAAEKPVTELDKVRESKPEPAAAAAAAAPAAAPPKGAFAINLLSINTQKAAQQAQEKLRKEGIETFIRTAEIKGTTWYRVRAEGFANSQEAKKFLQDHQNHPEFNGAWISKN